MPLKWTIDRAPRMVAMTGGAEAWLAQQR